MRRNAARLSLITAALLTVASTAARAEAPRVVTSIKPVHSLVSAVMKGVGEPVLLVRGAASPHTYSMKPSDARALGNAALVFWVGPTLEGFLEKPLAANAGKARAIALLDQPGMTLLEGRKGGAWEPHDHADGHHGHGHAHKDHAHKEHAHKEHAHGNHGHDDHGHDDHGHGDDHDHDAMDTHIWLDPDNAKRIVAVAAEALAGADPANAAAYRANAAAAEARITALDAELKELLAPVAKKPFIVFHDAYQYYETHYALNGVGAITVNPERRPSAKRLTEIRARITELGAACVFAEPQFEPALVNTIAEGTPAKKGVLDPEGADIPDGPDLYPALMRNIATALKGCLGS